MKATMGKPTKVGEIIAEPVGPERTRSNPRMPRDGVLVRRMPPRGAESPQDSGVACRPEQVAKLDSR